MFSQIKTSAKNREIVVDLTRKFNLGAENVIARIAIAYSLKSGVKFNPMACSLEEMISSIPP